MKSGYRVYIRNKFSAKNLEGAWGDYRRIQNVNVTLVPNERERRLRGAEKKIPQVTLYIHLSMRNQKATKPN